MSAESEEQLIERAKVDEVAFGQLFDMYYPKIFNYILRRTGHVQLAQDLASETFFKAFNKRSSFTWRGVSFGAWLYRIATNEIKMQGRKTTSLSFETLYAESGLDVASPANLAEELLEAERLMQLEVDAKRLREALAALPEKYREVVALRFFGEKKIGDIAVVLGKREGTVKSLLSRAMDKLAEQLKMQPFEGGSILVEEDIEL
jgi:RNA polymerase sigma-70 factor (ECF subfamily)